MISGGGDQMGHRTNVSRLTGGSAAGLGRKIWLHVVACALTIIGLAYIYRRTLVGRCVSRDRRGQLPRARSACRTQPARPSYALAPGSRRRRPDLRRRLMLAFFATGALLNYGLCRGARRLGNNRGRPIGGLAAGPVQQSGISVVAPLLSVRGVKLLHRRVAGGAQGLSARSGRRCVTAHPQPPARSEAGELAPCGRKLAPFLAFLRCDDPAVVSRLLVADRHPSCDLLVRCPVFNMIVGFDGHLAIG